MTKELANGVRTGGSPMRDPWVWGPCWRRRPCGPPSTCCRPSPGEVVLSVNVSALVLFEDPDSAVMFTGEPASRLVLELTKHGRVSDYGRAGRPARAGPGWGQPARRLRCRARGELEHTLRLRPEGLELERVLVQGVAHNPDRQAMCEAMAGLAQDGPHARQREDSRLRRTSIHCATSASATPRATTSDDQRSPPGRSRLGSRSPTCASWCDEPTRT